MLDLWLAPFFADPIDKEEDVEDKTELESLQAEALRKQKDRNAAIGELLRSKGFLWLATSNGLIGAWQQAGNVLRIQCMGKWMCLKPDIWEGTSAEPLVRKVRILLLHHFNVTITL